MSFHNRDFGRKNAGARVDDAVEFTEVMAALKARDAEIKSFAEKADAEIKATGQMAAETKAALEKLSENGSALSERMQAIEQKMSRRSFGQPAAKSLGEQLAETESFKSLAASGHGTARLSVKATLTSSTTDAPGSAGDLIVPDRRPEIIRPAERRLRIRDLLLPGRTTSNSVEYMREKLFTNNAAPIEENPSGTKAESALQFEQKSAPVRTIAHWIPATKQVLADVPQLMSYVNERLITGLRFKEEDEILNGDGTGEHLDGIFENAAKFEESTLSQAGDTLLDTIRRAGLQVRLQELVPSFVCLHPIDYASAELTKDDNERYIWVTVPDGGVERIWRLAVIETTAIPQGEFLVGARDGAQVFDREDATVMVSTEHSDFFVKNKVAILAEERLALAVIRPEAFVHGQFELAQSPTIND